MEGRFSNFVKAELKALIEDIEAGRQPGNLVLHTVVIDWLRKQFDGRPKNDVMEFDGEYSGDMATLDEDDSGDDDEPL